MPSTYTTNNGIELIATGEQSGTWGATTNTNLSLVDTALDGQVTITLVATGSSGSPNDLPVTDGSTSNGRNRLIIYTDGGDLGGTVFVQLTPNDSEKIVYIRNSLTASRSILVFQGTYNASNDYEIPAGTTAVVYFNGGGAGAVAANVFNNAYFDSLRLGAVSVTSVLDEDNMASDSATSLATQQSIKAYVDTQLTAEDLDFGGDTGTGAVDLDSQTFTIAGTANEIETSASGQTLTVGLPNNVTIAGILTGASLDISGDIDIDGVSNLDVLDVDGAANFAADTTFAIGADIVTASAGTSNTRIGENAGIAIQAGGNYNVLVGFNAGNALTTGADNTAVGYNAGDAITTGARNTFIGSESGGLLTTGTQNTAIGDSALASGTTSNNNVAIGFQSLDATTTGFHNTAVGTSSIGSNTTGNYNTASGYSALAANTTGDSNTATGVSALEANTTAGNNTATGYRSLYSNTTGASNTASGYLALNANTTASNNTAHGRSALTSNTTGASNTASGFYALLSNTTGDSNTATGVSALRFNTTADSNTANGFNALYANTTGTQNTASGMSALYANTTGYFNTASGVTALYANTTGYYNTARGVSALQNNTTGYYNTASGVYALLNNTTGTYNTASGVNALTSNTTGAQNTASGVSALQNNTTGAANTAIGYSAGSTTTTGIHNISIGHNAQPTVVTASAQCTLGDANITNLRCNDTSISALSDSRDKTDVTDSPYGLDFINTVRPVQFKWESRDGNGKDGTTRVGFIAQELLAACGGNNAVLDLVLDDNPDKLEAKYGNLLPIMVQAIKELSAKNDDLEARILTLEGQTK